MYEEIKNKFNMRKMRWYVKQQRFLKKFCVLALIMGIMCTISGCRSAQEGIEVETQLPENTQLHFLLKCEKNVELEQPETEIETYYEDGFCCADIWYCGAEFRSGDMYKDSIYFGRIMFDNYVTYSELKKYVQKYNVIRFAVTDMEGNILQISSDFSLLVDNRNQFWRAVKYDYTANEITGKVTNILDESHSRKLWKWTFVSFFSVMLLFIFGLVFLLNDKQQIILYPLFWVIFTIPVGIMIFLQYEEFFNPYYAVNHTLKEGRATMCICDLPWLLISIVFLIRFFYLRGCIKKKTESLLR